MNGQFFSDSRNKINIPTNTPRPTDKNNNKKSEITSLSASRNKDAIATISNSQEAYRTHMFVTSYDLLLFILAMSQSKVFFSI